MWSFLLQKSLWFPWTLFSALRSEGFRVTGVRDLWPPEAPKTEFKIWLWEYVQCFLMSQRESVLFSRALRVWLLLLHRDVTFDLFPEFLKVFWDLNDHECRSWRRVGWCFCAGGLFFSLSVWICSAQVSTLRVCVYCTCVSVCVGVHMCLCGGVFGAMGTDIWQRSHAQKKKVRPREEEKLFSIIFNHQSVSIRTTMQSLFYFALTFFYFALTFATAGSRTSVTGRARYCLEMSCDLFVIMKDERPLHLFQTFTHFSGPERVCRCSMREIKLQITGISTIVGARSLSRGSSSLFPSWSERNWSSKSAHRSRSDKLVPLLFQLAEFWTICQTKEAIWRCYLGLREHLDIWNTVSKKISSNIYSKTFLFAWKFAAKWRHEHICRCGESLIYSLRTRPL